MNSDKIVFIQPPVSLEDVYGGLAKVGAVSPPLNLLLLAAIVRKMGFNPYIIDCPALGLSYEGVVARLRTIKAKFIGLTAMTPHIMQAAKLAKIIKKEFPETTIILGGAHVSSLPEETMLRFPEIDIGAIGEADDSLPEMLHAVNNSIPLNRLKGLICRDNGKLTNTGQRLEEIELDTLPIYAWDLLEGFPHVYKTPLFATHRAPATPILTSRGCPGKCIFCYSGCHITRSTYSAEYIISILKHLKEKYGIREFILFDDNFVMFRKNLLKLLSMLIAEKLDLTWSCNSRIDMVNEEMLSLMANAGCWQVSYGIETGNQKILDSLGKHITKEKIVETIQLTRKAGIRTVGYFMIGHFGETQETIEETIQFACTAGLDDFRMSFFTPLPGTMAYPMAEHYGEFDNSWEKMTLFSPVFTPKGMTKEQLIKWQKLAIRKFFFRPRALWSFLKMVKHPVIALKGAYLLGRYVWGSATR